MFCSSCGEKISDGGKFCGYCGAVGDDPKASMKTASESDQDMREVSSGRELQMALLLSEAKDSANNIIWQGVGWIVAGILITTITYAMAEPGGTYLIFWGLSVYGLYLVIKGGYYRMAPHKLIEKAFPNMTEAGDEKEE